MKLESIYSSFIAVLLHLMIRDTYIHPVVFTASVPQIHLHPMEKTVRINNDSTTIDLTCMANGASSYFWIKRNGSISSTAEGVNTNKLLLQNIVPSDSGFYQCVAVNENGTSYSNYGRLTVEGNKYYLCQMIFL